jgi:hypothetical protein
VKVSLDDWPLQGSSRQTNQSTINYMHLHPQVLGEGLWRANTLAPHAAEKYVAL